MLRETVIADGQSAYLMLHEKLSKIRVVYTGAATGTLTPQESANQTEPVEIELPDGSTTITGSRVFTVAGPGFISFNATGVSGVITAYVEAI